MPDDENFEGPATSRAVVVFCWLLVSLPLLWGVWSTVRKAAMLFR